MVLTMHFVDRIPCHLSRSLRCSDRLFRRCNRAFIRESARYGGGHVWVLGTWRRKSACVADPIPDTRAPRYLTSSSGLLSLATAEEPEDKGTAHEEKSEDNADNCAGPAGEVAATTAAGWDSGRGDVVVRAVVRIVSFDRTGV